MKYAKRILRRLLKVPINLVHSIAILPFFQDKINNYLNTLASGDAIKKKELVADEQKIVDSVIASGLFITSLEELQGIHTKPMLDAATAILNEFNVDLNNSTASRETGLAIAAATKKFTSDPNIYRWGLDERLLRLVECYFGMPVAFGGLDFFYTPIDHTEGGARIWHRDGEDERIIKIVVYLNDVDAKGGPFEVLNHTLSDVSSARAAALSSKQLVALFGKELSSSDIISCVGPAGTVIIADTAKHYHRGKPVFSKARSAIFYNYYPRPPRYPYYCPRSVIPKDNLLKALSGLTPYQVECAVWRDNLPKIAKVAMRMRFEF